MPNRVIPNQATLPMRDDRETLEVVRRKLGFRAWRRGTCEADLLIGAFADQCLTEFGAEELRQFERLLQEDDPVIDDWITGRQLVPKRHDNRVMASLREFRLAVSAYPRRAISCSLLNGNAGTPPHR